MNETTNHRAGGLLATMNTASLVRGLRLSPTEIHLVKTTAIASSIDPLRYCREAIREQLARDRGRAFVVARWTS